MMEDESKSNPDCAFHGQADLYKDLYKAVFLPLDSNAVVSTSFQTYQRTYSVKPTEYTYADYAKRIHELTLSYMKAKEVKKDEG